MTANYPVLDRPDVLQYLFHPRPEPGYRKTKENRDDLFIPVAGDVVIQASCHEVQKNAPTILFFHGNGEIVADYDDFGQFYTDMGINFFVVDYRGYGASTGTPTVASMMEDCHRVLDFLLSYRDKKQLTGPVCLMGRSLGSASAIELAARRAKDISCLIIESGFAYAGPLLNVLGIDSASIGYKEEQGFENVDKIKLFSKPSLVIHAEYDHIIPFSDGKALFDALVSKDKFFLEVKGANHNDIFMRGMSAYLAQVQKICFLNI